MNLETIAKTLQLRIHTRGDRLGVEVRGGYVGDLLSDVMANSREGELWITRQTHQNVVAVASLKELAGVILVKGAEPAADTLDKAARENIPLFTTDLSAFETAGRVHRMIFPREE